MIQRIGTELLKYASVTQYLVAINVLIYAIQLLNQPTVDGAQGSLFSMLSLRQVSWFEIEFGLLTPAQFPNVIWQVFTSSFLHGSFFHIGFNMFVLWQFGQLLERVWGSAYFLKYYIICGIGSGITVIVINMLTGGDLGITVGASGAIFGLLLAFGILFPRERLYMFFAIPMEARYAVIVLAVASVFFQLSGFLSGISHIGHLGGLLFGFLLLKGPSLLRRL